MQGTSLDAYQSIKVELNKKEKIVLEKFKENGNCTNEKLSDLLGWSINRVTGRTNKLVEKGLVKKMYREPSPSSGRMCIVWGIDTSA